MSYHTCKFVIVEPVDYSCCQRNRVALFIYTACKSVQLRVVYDVNLWHIHVACHAKIFNDIVDFGIFLTCKRSCSCSGTYHCRICKIRYCKPYSYAHDDPWYGVHEVIVYCCGVKLVYNVAVLVVVSVSEIVYQCEEYPYHAQDYYGKQDQQHYCQSVVAHNLGVHSDISHICLRFMLEFNFRCLVVYSAFFLWNLEHRFFFKSEHFGKDV